MVQNIENCTEGCIENCIESSIEYSMEYEILTRTPEHARNDEEGWAVSYQYLLLMLGCLLLTLPLEWLLQARVYRRFRLVLIALLPVVVVFSVWDIVGIARNHWSYNPNYVTGVQLPFAMPIEELVFFIVIPLCGLLTYEAVGTGLRWMSDRRSRDVRQPRQPLPDHRGPA